MQVATALVREIKTKVSIRRGKELSEQEKAELKTLWRTFTILALPRERTDHFRFFQFYPQNFYCLLVSQETGELLGAATLVPNMSSQKWYVSLEDMVIAPPHRRLAYGRKFLRRIMDWVQESDDYFFLQASVHPDRKEMNELCQKAGMRMVAQATGSEPGCVNLYRLTLVASD